MADIRNTISLKDQVTPTLRSILKAMDSTLKVMDLMDKQAGKGIQSKAIKQAEKDIKSANNALIKMGNYAELSNNKLQKSTQKSIRQMNALEASILGITKLLPKIKSIPVSTPIGYVSKSVSDKLASAKNFMSAPFANMQDKGTQMMLNSMMIGGSKIQGMLGGVLKTVGNVGSKAGSIFSKIGSIAVTSFKIASNTVSQFSASVNSAFTSLAKKAAIAWNTVASGIYVVKQAMARLSSMASLTDKVISDTTRLNLQNHSGLSVAESYGLAYRAAQASRSDISTTSDLASKIAMSGVYGKGKGSLESSINMAEIIQKALTVGGGTSEQNSRAILQLSQGLSSGKLQGDELRSIREQSPYLADILAQGLGKVDESFVGTTAGDLKQLGSEGKLTSEVVIKAFEAMEDQINQTFAEKAPRTWGQGMTSVGNTVKYVIGILQQMEGGPLQKISNLMWTISDYLQSTEGIQVLTGIATVIGVIGDALTFVVSSALNLVSWLIENSYILIAVFLVLGVIAMVSGIKALVAWIAAVWPLLLIIAVVAIIIKVLLDLGVTFGEIAGGICGGIMVIISFFKNLGLAVWGIIKGVWEILKGAVTNIGLQFQNVGLGIKSFFAGILSDVLGFVASIAEALNKLPFIDFDYSGVTDAATYWANQQASAQADIAANKAAMVDVWGNAKNAFDSVGAFDDGWASDAFDVGYNWGSGVVDGIGETALNIQSAFDTSALMADMPTTTTIDGGSLDSVDSIGSDVDISDEDIRLLRDMAARDFLLQMQTVTPVAHVTFGDVRETADVNKIVEVIENMVEEQMATALVS